MSFTNAAASFLAPTGAQGVKMSVRACVRACVCDIPQENIENEF